MKKEDEKNTAIGERVQGLMSASKTCVILGKSLHLSELQIPNQ
jgi:hypothetical protein